jgi:5-methyltetrahydropteroyltriglutamate--homocysteine methyltransferase
LIDRAALGGKVPRVRAPDLWRVAPDELQKAQDAATEAAVRSMESAGIDILTDGEIRRESYSNHFVGQLTGFDHERPAEAKTRSGRTNLVPRVTAPIGRPTPVGTRDISFLRSLTDKPIKATVPGPFTMSQQASNEYYEDDRALALALADAVNAELKDLSAAGADIVQLDEPWLTARPEEARRFAAEAIARALDGVSAVTAIHLCHGYAAVVRDKANEYTYLEKLADLSIEQISIEAAQPRLDMSVLRSFPRQTVVVGVLDLGDTSVESVEVIVDRIRRALAHIDPERLMVAPDCGMKYLDEEVALGKLRAMVEAAERVYREISGGSFARTRPL